MDNGYNTLAFARAIHLLIDLAIFEIVLSVANSKCIDSVLVEDGPEFREEFG